MPRTKDHQSAAARVAARVARGDSRTMDQSQILQACAQEGLTWPGCNGALFGGRVPWLAKVGDAYLLTSAGLDRL